MSGNALPVLGMALSVSAMVVGLMARPAARPEAEPLAPRLSYLEQHAREGRRFASEELDFLRDAGSRLEKAEEKASGLEKALDAPSDQALRARAGDIIDANWPLFIQRYMYASGRIGVLSAAEKKTAEALGRRFGDEVGRLGLAGEAREKARNAVGEALVLMSKARHQLGKWPKALEIERERIIRETLAGLKRVVPAARTEAARRWLEEKIR